jgi:hypothetical protein
VRKLFLDLYFNLLELDWNSKSVEMDNQLSTLLPYLTNLRDLTIHVVCDSRVTFPYLLNTIKANLSGLVHFKLVEIVSPITAWVMRRTVFRFTDIIVRLVLDNSGSTLQSLVVDGLSVMSTSTFMALRSQAKVLRTILFRTFLGYECRELLCEPTEWACNATLRTLAFYHCGGAHAGGVVCGVGNGNWAKELKVLEVVKSGHAGDVVTLPYPLHCKIPALKKVRWEHAAEWELDHLAQLPAKEVILALIPRSDVIALIVRDDRLKATQKLSVVPINDTGRDDTEIDKICDSRGILLEKNASPILPCTCPHRD